MWVTDLTNYSFLAIAPTVAATTVATVKTVATVATVATLKTRKKPPPRIKVHSPRRMSMRRISSPALVRRRLGTVIDVVVVVVMAVVCCCLLLSVVVEPSQTKKAGFAGNKTN